MALASFELCAYAHQRRLILNLWCSSMVRRFFRYLFISIVVVFGVIGALTAYSYYFPPRYEASAKLADSASEIIVQIEPMHPYLAEYRRSLVLRKKGAPDERIEMFPDTGGYLRTQLYRLPDGTFLVSGFFDAFKIDPVKHSIVLYNETVTHVGTYLGAFDDSAKHEWRFIDASQSPEQELVAQGG